MFFFLSVFSLELNKAFESILSKIVRCKIRHLKHAYNYIFIVQKVIKNICIYVGLLDNAIRFALTRKWLENTTCA